MTIKHNEFSIAKRITNKINSNFYFIHRRRTPDKQDKVFMSAAPQEYKNLTVGGRGNTLELAEENFYKSFEKKTKYIKSEAIFWKKVPKLEIAENNKRGTYAFVANFLLRVDNE